MTATTRWAIESLECVKQDQGYTDVVYNIHWRLYANDDGYSTSIYGTQLVNFDPDSPGYQFIPYEELDEETVLSWLFTAMTPEKVTEQEQLVISILAGMMDPPTEIKPLPWASPL